MNRETRTPCCHATSASTPSTAIGCAKRDARTSANAAGGPRRAGAPTGAAWESPVGHSRHSAMARSMQVSGRGGATVASYETVLPTKGLQRGCQTIAGRGTGEGGTVLQLHEHSLDQLREIACYPLAHRKYVLVGDLLGRESGGEVRDHGEPEHAQGARPSCDDLRHGGHAHCIGAE